MGYLPIVFTDKTTDRLLCTYTEHINVYLDAAVEPATLDIAVIFPTKCDVKYVDINTYALGTPYISKYL